MPYSVPMRAVSMCLMILVAGACTSTSPQTLDDTESPPETSPETVDDETPTPDPDAGPTGPTLEPMFHEFDTVALAPGVEHNGWCQSWNLNNPEALYINSVKLDTDGGYHHSNWFFVPEGKHDYPSGLWKKCYSNGFSEVDAALMGGVLFAQSTQVDGETQQFPPGVAVRIPPWSRIIGATHLLNPSVDPLETGLRMTLQPLPEAEVEVVLTPFRLSYLDLFIPPKSNADFTAECLFRQTYENVAEVPLDMKLYWVLPHYHVLGNGFRLELAGGERDGELIFQSEPWAPEPFGKVFETPFDVSGADGFRFTCSYYNTFDKVIEWGIGDDEMCVMLGFAESRLAFDMSVIEGELEKVDDTTYASTGPCVIAPIPYELDKEGGLPPEERD